MTEEEKAFLERLTEAISVNVVAIRRLNDVLQGLALAVERLALPEGRMSFKDGMWTTDLVGRPLACRALVTAPDESGPLPCGRPSDDAIHDTSKGHVFRSA